MRFPSILLALALSATAFLPATGLAARDCQDVLIEIHVESAPATQTGGGTGTFVADIDAMGTGTRCTPNGNGVQTKGTLDQVTVTISEVTMDEEGNEEQTPVEQFEASMMFHAQQASAIAQGLESGSFKFNAQLTGRTKFGVTVGEQTEKVLAFQFRGDAICMTDENGEQTCPITGRGSANMKSGGETRHYNILIGGESTSSGMIG